MRHLIARHRRACAALLAALAAVLGLLALRPDGPAQRAGPVAHRPAIPPGLVAAPVRFADAGAVGLVRPGDRVDVIAAGSAGAQLLAASVPVLAVPRPAPGEQSGLLVVAVPRAQAVHLAAGTAAQRLSFSLVRERD
ncbi:MAG: hypothetical protein ABIS86_17095 [Streptosporangiaceae bacterium]